MGSNEIIAKALCADDDKLWHSSHDLWEQALIAIVKEKHADWYGTSLVILGHIYDIMTKQFNFKMESSMQHFESEKKYKPVGHFANVKNNEDKINVLQSSDYSFILAITSIILLFFVLSYPLNDFETKIMVGLGLLLFIVIGFIIGLLFNIFAGVVAFVGECYFFDAICRLVANIFHLADGDMAMLYIFRIISVILAIYLIYSAFKGKDNDKGATRLMVVTMQDRGIPTPSSPVLNNS